MVLAAVVVALGIAALGVAAALRPKRATYSFEDRDTYLLLVIRGRLASDERELVAMRTLREGLQLKLTAGYSRVLLDVRGAEGPDSPSFWRLIGGLGPAFLTEGAKLAVVVSDRSDLGTQFRHAGFVDVFASEHEALAHLRSTDPARPQMLDRGWVESLLVGKAQSPGQSGSFSPPRRT